MALYPYVATLAVDPVTLVKAAGATGVIYAPGDTSFASPLTATDATGNPIPLTANADGILPSFYATSPAVNWRSGSYVFPLVTSQPLPGEKGETGTPGKDGSNVVPTAEAIATEIQTPGTPANAALSATTAQKVDELAPRNASNPAPVGNAPHVQFGPILRSRHFAGALILQDDQTPSIGNPTRLCVVPRASVTAGVGGVIKVFGDPWIDGNSYRDLGLYFAADQSNAGVFGDKGTHSTGVFWINSKRGAGTDGNPYAGINPDIGFSFQDGETVGGRFAHINSGRPAFIVGRGKPDIAKVPSLTDVRLEVQGDIGLSGINRKVRWYSTESTVDANGDVTAFGVANNLMDLGTNQFSLTLAGARRLLVHADGSVVMGDGVNRLTTTTTAGFLYVRSMNGAPTGTPSFASRAGTVALSYDEANDKLWVFAPADGAWKSVTLT